VSFLIYSMSKKCHDLEIQVKGHSRSSEPTRIDPPPMTSYSHSIVTMGLSRTVSEINSDLSQKSPIFHTPHVFNAPVERFPSEWVSAQGVKKLEWWGYQIVHLTIQSTVKVIHVKGCVLMQLISLQILLSSKLWEASGVSCCR